MMLVSESIRKKLAVITVIVASMIYVWPLTDYENNLVGVGGDIYSHVWYVDWFCKNYFKLNFITPKLFAPRGVNMAKGYDMATVTTATCPFTKVHPVAGMNALAVLQLVLIWVSSYYVAKKYFKHPGTRTAFIFFYSFSPFALARMQGHYNLVGTVWASSALMLFVHKLDLTSKKQTVKAAIFTALAYASTWQNWANLSPLLCILMIDNLWNAKTKLRIAIQNLLIAICAGALIIAPFVVPMISANVGEKLSTQSTQLVSFANLYSYIMPWKNSFWYKLYPEFMRRDNHFLERVVGMDPIIILLFFGLTVTAIAKREKQSQKLFLFCIIVYVAITFGHSQQIGSKFYFLGHPEWLYKYPPLMLTRVPSRVAVVWILLTLKFTLSELEKRLERKTSNLKAMGLYSLGVYAIFSTTIGSKNVQVNYIPYQEKFPINALQQLQQDQLNKYVLNLPLKNDQTQNFMQLFHGKDIISGYIAYSIVEPDTDSTINHSPLLRVLNCNRASLFINHIPWSDQDFEPIFMSYITQNNVGYMIANFEEFESDNCRDFSDWIQNNMLFYKGIEVLYQDKNYAVTKIYNEASYEPSIFISIEPNQFTARNNTLLLNNEVGSMSLFSNKSIDIVYDLDMQIPANVTVKVRDSAQEVVYDTGNVYHKESLHLEEGQNYISLIVECHSSDPCEPIAITNLNAEH